MKGHSSIIDGASGVRRALLQKTGFLNFPYSSWDSGIYGPIIKVAEDGTYLMFYTGYNDDWSEHYPCVAQSVDRVTWTKPNIGLVDLGGSVGTDNNIIIDLPVPLMNIPDVLISEGRYWLPIFYVPNSNTYLYSSDDGLTWINEAVTMIDDTQPVFREPKGFLFEDGKYRLYYSQGHAADTRSLGYYEFYPINVIDNSGVTYDEGFCPDFTSAFIDFQFYDIVFLKYRGSVFGIVARYAATPDRLGPIELWRNDTGGAGTVAGSWENCGELIRNGADGEFDDMNVTVSAPILIEGMWQMIYTGSPWPHDVIGRAMQLMTAEARVDGYISPVQTTVISGQAPSIIPSDIKIGE